LRGHGPETAGGLQEHVIVPAAAVEAASLEDGVLAASTIIVSGAVGKDACSPSLIPHPPRCLRDLHEADVRAAASAFEETHPAAVLSGREYLDLLTFEGFG
jgi:hypothetical protein